MNNLDARAIRHLRRHLRSCVALSLLAIFATAQVRSAYSGDLSKPEVSRVNSCTVDSSISDFNAGLKQLAETVTGRTDIRPEFLQRYFVGCKIEEVREFLARNGFATGVSAPAFGEREAGITRTILAEKVMQRFDHSVSLNCRIILQTDSSDAFKFRGFLYFDGP